MVRPISTATTIVAKLSSASTISPASFVTSVPAIPIATPMSAVLSAAASLTPSPVIATTLRRRWSASTIRTLCSGATRAKTPRSSICSLSCSTSRSSSSRPVMAAPGMPRSVAMDRAVAAWSPVIILTWIPASWHRAMASVASGRAGSRIPTRASRRRSSTRAKRSCSGASSTVPVSSIVRLATASTRRPRAARISMSSSSSRRRASSMAGASPWASADQPHRSSNASGAPLTLICRQPSASGSRWNVAMNLWTESNGISAIRGRRARSTLASTPALAASTTRAASVGSPTIPPSAVSALLLHTTADTSAGRRSETSALPGPVIRPSGS